jgi:hypothetical protein
VVTDLEKIRENRLRRMAQRQGYTLRKSRRRDPRALDFGGYALIDPWSRGPVFGFGRNGPDANLDLDQIEGFLTED